MLLALKGISLGDVQELQILAWLGTAHAGEVTAFRAKVL